ncbi:antibiotic biosynthesis monooxygenase [Pseudoalteromonas arctica]|uniref:ABM domain-containing protein n=1 Tax=Pseudoalteromonas arctica TaxID=394751 RepID=A0A7Y0DQS2_9GAMM|nr:antibiotic biosynthesis monooxygenase [Pseudoalteromonas arctica]NMM39945.1 hypothetical protein [Pseudoalteromonas arctica]
MNNDTGISVIVHEVNPDHQALYEQWMSKAIEAHQKFSGFLATDIVKPVGEQLRYVIILRFISKEYVLLWLKSDVRQALLRESLPWLKEDYYRTGEDSKFWFEPLQTRVTVARWKQWLLSWGIVLPLTIIIPWAMSAFFELAHLNIPSYFSQVLVAGLVSLSMVYWLMPLATRTLSRWLLR